MLARDLLTNIRLRTVEQSKLTFYLKRLRQDTTTRRIGSVLIVLALTFQVITFLSPPKASDAASTNDVITGGFVSKADLLAKWDADTDLNQLVYGHFGITRADIASPNTVDTIITGNQGLWSVGHNPHSSQDVAFNIFQATMYIRPLSSWGTSATYKALTGVTKYGVRFYIIYDCGNPAFVGIPPLPPPPVITPPPPPKTTTPTFSCQSLTSTPASGTAPLTVNFVALASVNGTTVKDYLFDFGDGTTLTSPIRTVTHKYAAAGKYAAHVRIETVAGTTAVTPICQTQTTVTAVKQPVVPAFACLALAGSPLSGNAPLTVNFTTTPSVTNTTVSDYLYDFGDGATATTATAIASHTYTTPGNYDATVRVQTPAGTTAATAACQLPLSVTAPNLGYLKTADNLTVLTADGQPSNAAGTTAQPGNQIRYNLTVINNGSGAYSGFTFKENINDILEYADIVSTGGADNSSGELTWPSVDIAAHASAVRTFTVQIKDPIPDTPTSVTDPQSFDLHLDNVFFANTVRINVPAPPAKVIETTTQTLPQTGAGWMNIILALFAAGATFMFLRSKLLGHELAIATRLAGGE